MKLHVAYIPLLLITSQSIDSEHKIPGKYIGHLFGKKYELKLKKNGKFIKRVITIEPYDPIHRGPYPYFDFPDTKPDRGRSKTKGSWVYFKSDSLDGIVLNASSYTDSLYFLENGNLSPIKPFIYTVESHTNEVNDSTAIVIRNYKNTSETRIGVEYRKK